MIEGGWNFVAAAYVATGLCLGALAVVALVHARTWAKRARDLESRE